MYCKYCVNAAELGWWGDSDITHCPDCHATWAGERMAHCTVAGGCHRTFSTARNHELAHLGEGCVSDAELRQLGLVPVDHAHGLLWRAAKRWLAMSDPTVALKGPVPEAEELIPEESSHLV